MDGAGAGAAGLAGGFLGLKPYLNQAPIHIPSAEITIYDFLPHAHLEVADAHGWIVLLHIPRPARLRDPLNLASLREIERRYPHLHLVNAHIGRAYCPEDIGDALEVLADTERMSFDFSANVNATVIEQALRTSARAGWCSAATCPSCACACAASARTEHISTWCPPGSMGCQGRLAYPRSHARGRRKAILLPV